MNNKCRQAHFTFIWFFVLIKCTFCKHFPGLWSAYFEHKIYQQKQNYSWIECKKCKKENSFFLYWNCKYSIFWLPHIFPKREKRKMCAVRNDVRCQAIQLFQFQKTSFLLIWVFILNGGAVVFCCCFLLLFSVAKWYIGNRFSRKRTYIYISIYR